jgi:ABC-type oligopeptide transport system ATPase subunit
MLDLVLEIEQRPHVEIGRAERICTMPEHPCTKALVSAVPRAHPGAAASPAA